MIGYDTRTPELSPFDEGVQDDLFAEIVGIIVLSTIAAVETDSTDDVLPMQFTQIKAFNSRL